MAVTFVGDIHGWSDRLERVLAQVAGDLVFLGDLIDRGPDAPGVVRRVRGLCESGRAQCVMGNHEYAMVRGLGCPTLGIAADPRMFMAWRDRFGGDAVLTAYGVGQDSPDGLRTALGDDLRWLAELPWVLEGDSEERHWLAVHAGFAEAPLAPQLAALRRGWAEDDGAPAALFHKPRAHQNPSDLPADWCTVSGHTPMPRAVVQHRRILCDTSGGLPRRLLSAVTFPSGKVVTG